MDDLPNIFLRRLEGRLGDIAAQLSRARFSSLHRRESWSPAINAYRCQNAYVICADLAGVDRSQIKLTVEPRRVWIRGRRISPEPGGREGPLLQVLALEIDHGLFERELVLPDAVDPDRVRAEHREGLLWIYLPMPEKE